MTQLIFYEQTQGEYVYSTLTEKLKINSYLTEESIDDWMLWGWSLTLWRKKVVQKIECQLQLLLSGFQERKEEDGSYSWLIF